MLLLAELGVRDTRLLAMAYSAALFALPAALYHLALARVRHDAVLLGIVIAVVAVVYLPTSLLHRRRVQRDLRRRDRRHGGGADDGAQDRRGDAVLLCVLGAALRALLRGHGLSRPAAGRRHRLVGAPRQATSRPALLAGIAALAFIGAAVVSAATIADYWNHPHFIKVRSTSVDFWQNLQFAIPLAGLRDLRGGRPASGRPGCRGAGRSSSWASPPPCSRLTPWWRLLHEHSILYPPAHYLARQAAGVLLAVLLGCMWLHVAWQRKAAAGPCHAARCRRSRGAWSLP